MSETDRTEAREAAELPTGDEPGFGGEHRLAIALALVELGKLPANENATECYLAQLIANWERRGHARGFREARELCDSAALDEEAEALAAHNGERINDAVQNGSWGAARRIGARIRALEPGAAKREGDG